MSATQRWRTMIEDEHAQSHQARGGAESPSDHWSPYAAQFAVDPYRADDPLLDRLAQDLYREYTLLDVGAGGGRYALPLALKCAQVIAVEPSASMAQVLRQQVAAHNIRNLSIVESDWGTAQVTPADVVICAHVVYVAQGIEPFLRKLEANARKRVMLVLYQVNPQAYLFPLWQKVRGERRLPLPCLPELLEVMKELDITPHIDKLPAHQPRSFDSAEQALEQIGDRLYLTQGSAQYHLLEKTLVELLEKGEGGYRVSGSPMLEPHVVWWEPASRC